MVHQQSISLITLATVLADMHLGYSINSCICISMCPSLALTFNIEMCVYHVYSRISHNTRNRVVCMMTHDAHSAQSTVGILSRHTCLDSDRYESLSDVKK